MGRVKFPPFLGAALLPLLLLLVYAGSFDNAFHYDDIHSLVENPHIRSLANIPAFFHQPELFSEDPKGAMFRPLVLTSYALNYALGEYRVEGYHLFNLLLHLANSLLVYLILNKWWGSPMKAFAGGALFALHPINCESVNYICSRS